MNALLATTNDNPKTAPDGSGDHNVRLAIDENVSNWSTTPTAHVRDLVAAGIKPAGLAVYFAIADRQMTAKGQYFRSNERLAEETGLSARTVSRQISLLKKSKMITVFYVNKQRRMRVLTTPSVSIPLDTSGVTPRHQCLTDKENSKKENNTTKKVCVFSASLLDREDGVLWGGALERLAATHGEEAVMRGLSVYDSYDPKTIDKPIGFLTKAIELKWEPAKSKTKKKLEPVYWNESEYMKGCK